jgi:branched-subunit amino acid transport protein
MGKLLITVVFMELATYIPRVVPLTLLANKRLPEFLRSFLYYIPFAVLGALIFPAILFSTGDMNSALAGTVIAVICAYMRLNVIVVVFGSILGVFAYQMLFL